MARLSSHEIIELHTTAIQVGLADKRDSLLDGIDRAFVASLRVSAVPTDQVLSDLHRLNDAGQLVDGTEPLLQWLQNALAIAGTGRDTTIFAQFLRRHSRAPISTRTLPPLGPKTSSTHVSSTSRGIRMHVAHWHEDRPAQFAYVRTSDGLVKAYTALEFRLNIFFANTDADDLIVHRLLCRTVRHRSIGGERVVVQTKAKGIFRPQRLTFCPMTASLASVDILRGKALRVHGHGTELLRAKLSSKVQPGLYELLFCAEAMSAGKRHTFTSDVFSLIVEHGGEDAAHLQVFGKHYDEPVERLLDLPEPLWRRISLPAIWPVLRYLGPLPSEVMKCLPYSDAWTVRDEMGTIGPDNGAAFDGSNVSDILTLPGPVNEHRYRLEDGRARIEALRALGYRP